MVVMGVGQLLAQAGVLASAEVEANRGAAAAPPVPPAIMAASAANAGAGATAADASTQHPDAVTAQPQLLLPVIAAAVASMAGEGGSGGGSKSSSSPAGRLAGVATGLAASKAAPLAGSSTGFGTPGGGLGSSSGSPTMGAGSSSGAAAAPGFGGDSGGQHQQQQQQQQQPAAQPAAAVDRRNPLCWCKALLQGLRSKSFTGHDLFEAIISTFGAGWRITLGGGAGGAGLQAQVQLVVPPHLVLFPEPRAVDWKAVVLWWFQPNVSMQQQQAGGGGVCVSASLKPLSGFPLPQQIQFGQLSTVLMAVSYALAIMAPEDGAGMLGESWCRLRSITPVSASTEVIPLGQGPPTARMAPAAGAPSNQLAATDGGSTAAVAVVAVGARGNVSQLSSLSRLTSQGHPPNSSSSPGGAGRSSRSLSRTQKQERGGSEPGSGRMQRGSDDMEEDIPCSHDCRHDRSRSRSGDLNHNHRRRNRSSDS